MKMRTIETNFEYRFSVQKAATLLEVVLVLALQIGTSLVERNRVGKRWKAFLLSTDLRYIPMQISSQLISCST